MTYRPGRSPVVFGTCRFESVLFSNRWRLVQDRQILAELQRVPTRHMSLLRLADRTLIELRPFGWGTVIAYRGDEEVARVERRSWWGRHWDLAGPGFACALTSDPLPRRWSLRYGNEPVGRLAGALLSYNRLTVHTDVAVPMTSLALAWHVLARPWEAAAAPGALVPAREPYTLLGQSA
jgi:hypothetical protein